MTWAPEFQSIDEAQLSVFDRLLTSGQPASPRGMGTLECEAVSFSILDPRRRCVLNPARRWSLPLALGETCWHLSGSTAAKDLAYYAPIWGSLADDEGQIRGSCYGSKIFVGDPSPWDLIIRLLQKDHSSRRAILYFSDEHSPFDGDSPDVACAQSIQFLLRLGKLDAVVCMRSNDAVWGLPYDVFLFTFIQELLSVRLGVELGTYFHFAASLHIYERHFELAREVLKCPRSLDFSMTPIHNIDALDDFLACERNLRSHDADLTPALGSYWQDLLSVLRLLRQSREVGWSRALELKPDLVYMPVLRPLATRQAWTVAA
jgi:thymidylate synthase